MFSEKNHRSKPPHCKNITKKFYRAKVTRVHKSRREKVSPRANVSPRAKDPRAKVTPCKSVPSCKIDARAKVSLVQK